MKTDNLITGLFILEKYRNKSGGYNTAAEHDVIYVYPTDVKVSEEDADKMIELGWLRDTKDDSWYCYT